MNSLDWLSFDLGIMLPGAACLLGGFQATLMIETISFIVVIVFLLALWRRAKAKQQPDADMYLERLIYFVKFFLPPVTRTLCQALSCAEYKGAQGGGVANVLIVDFNINCDSEAYTAIQAYAVVGDKGLWI